MSALGQKRTSPNVGAMSALPPIADIRQRGRPVRSVVADRVETTIMSVESLEPLGALSERHGREYSMCRPILAFILIVAGVILADQAAAGWKRIGCTLPQDETLVWPLGWWPVAWKYPCKKPMRDFAPSACWHTYSIHTIFAVEWHQDYICR